jgi:hypothetical protein
MPIHPSSMSRWRKRVGDAGAEQYLLVANDAEKGTGPIDPISRLPGHRQNEYLTKAHLVFAFRPALR